MHTIQSIGIVLMLAGITCMVWGALDFMNQRQSIDLGDARLVLEDKNLPPTALAGMILFLIGAAISISAEEKQSVRHA